MKKIKDIIDQKLQNAIFDMDNQLDECMRHHTFVEGLGFNELTIQKFGNIVENVKCWMRASDLKYYIVQEKETKRIGTLICWSEPYDFECPYSGYILVRDLNKGTSRTRGEIKE